MRQVVVPCPKDTALTVMAGSKTSGAPLSGAFSVPPVLTWAAALVALRAAAGVLLRAAGGALVATPALLARVATTVALPAALGLAFEVGMPNRISTSTNEPSPERSVKSYQR